jgi:hypothetical protein
VPASYKIDKDRRLVMSTGSGVFKKDEVLSHQGELLADPDFNPNYSQLVDFTRVTKFDLSAADVRILAERDVFAPDARRAFIVPTELAFGLARMYGVHREDAGEKGIRIFRNKEEALDWVLAKAAGSK